MADRMFGVAAAPTLETPAKTIESVQVRRPSWGKVRADYEAQQRKAFWQSQIELVEQADKLRESKTSDIDEQQLEGESDVSATSPT